MDNLDEMDNLLETYNFPKLNQVESENLNKLITTTKIKTLIKKLPANKSPGPGDFTGEFCLTFKEHLPFSNYFNKFKRRKDSQAHFMRHAISDSKRR